MTSGAEARPRALVTGAARRLGRAMALRLAEDGADIVVTGRAKNPDDLPDNEKEIGWTGVQSLAEEIEAKIKESLEAYAVGQLN